MKKLSITYMPVMSKDKFTACACTACAFVYLGNACCGEVVRAIMKFTKGRRTACYHAGISYWQMRTGKRK